MLLALLPSLSLVLQAIQTPVQRRDFTLLSPRAERIDLLKNADYEYILAKMPAHKTRSSERLNNDPDMSNDSENWKQVKRRQPRPASFADATRSKIAAVGLQGRSHLGRSASAAATNVSDASVFANRSRWMLTLAASKLSDCDSGKGAEALPGVLLPGPLAPEPRWRRHYPTL